MDYGVTSNGFVIKPYSVCLNEIITLFKQSFGKIREDSESKFYQLAQIFALREAELWETFNALWDRMNINSAEGSFLDDLVAGFVTRLPATQSSVTLHAICDEGTLIPSGTVFQCVTNNAQFVTTKDFTSTTSEIDFNVYSVENGPISAPADTITVIVSPITGLHSVTNPKAASPGRNEETDDELRFRFVSYARNYIGYSTLNSIQAKLEQKLVATGKVSSVNVFVNDTRNTDTEGRAPNSIEIVVDCPDTQEDYNTVAQAIFESKGASVPTHLDATFGVSGTAIDSKGESHQINFSKINHIPAYIRFEVTKSNETIFPANGEDLIKEYVVEYGEKYMSRPGQDLLSGPLTGQVFKVDGIRTCDTYVSLNGTTWNKNGYCSVSARERLQYNINNISIVWNI